MMVLNDSAEKIESTIQMRVCLPFKLMIFAFYYTASSLQSNIFISLELF